MSKTEIYDLHHEDAKKSFRNAMASLSAAVNVITTDGPAGMVGLTATAVTSITDTPPTILVSINRNSGTNPVFKANRKLAVNILASTQIEIAEHFAGMHRTTMSERFEKFPFKRGKFDLPILEGALANLEGTIVAVHEVGTHSLLIVELDEIIQRDSGDGLVYFARRFHRLPREIKEEE